MLPVLRVVTNKDVLSLLVLVVKIVELSGISSKLDREGPQYQPDKSELKLYRKSSLTTKNNIFSKMNINNEKQI